MKRRIVGMGHFNPAQVIPQHNAYHPTVSTEVFNTLLKYCDSTNNQNFADELVNLIVADITADNNAGNVPNQNIRDYYKKYYKIASNASSPSARCLQTLQQLV